MMAIVPHNLASTVQKFVRSRWWSLGFRLLTVALAMLHTWAAITAYSMNADGINYLDMGEAFWRGDWATAVNPVWSPLYGWLLGFVLLIIRPSMAWKFATVQLTNFFIFLFIFFAFERFWGKLYRIQTDKQWPTWSWWGLGYTLFIWGALNLIEMWAVTPDMLMAAFVLLAAVQFINIREGATRPQPYLWLGLLLGLGYLTKAIMLPISIIFLLMGVIIAQKRLYLSLSILGFLLISTPYIVLISQERGHLNWGDAGTITYVRYVNGLPYPHWQGGPPENGTPIHPSRQILTTPPIYEFDGPIAGTYPISYDPIYWYEGVQSHFDLVGQSKALIGSLLYYFDIFFKQLGVWIVAAVFLSRPWEWLWATIGRWRPSLTMVLDIIAQWGLALVGIAALGAYSLVLVEGRYVAVFIILLMGELLRQPFRADKTAVSFTSLIMISFMLFNILAFNLVGGLDLSANQAARVAADPPPSWPGETAEQLHQLGVQPGSKVGVIGYAFDSFWAKLAEVQIVAELLEDEAQPFWLGDEAKQQEVLAAFANVGVAAVVAERVPSYARVDLADWHQVGNSNFYIYVIENKP